MKYLIDLFAGVFGALIARIRWRAYPRPLHMSRLQGLEALFWTAFRPVGPDALIPVWIVEV
jgi:hypothetical protein